MKLMYRCAAGWILSLLGVGFASLTLAAEWTVAVHIHDARALSNSDTWGEQDMYRKIWIEPLIGSGATAYCDNEDNVDVDNNHVTPDDWGCVMKVTGGTNTQVRIRIQLWDDDISGDDELDLNLAHNQLGLEMRFEPRTSKLVIVGAGPGGVDQESCALGHIKKTGFGGGGDEPAEITFSITASAGGAPDGDTDGDRLLDTWEVCGINDDNDIEPELDLKSMGADPFRKDLFVEVDWMQDGTHTHEPWLPALIQAWTEFDRAPITNPTIDGSPHPSGIALHLDVGNLYASYNLNIDGAGPNEFEIGANGNIDLDHNPSTSRVTATTLPDGVRPTDIGNFGGGNSLTEIATLLHDGAVNPSHFNSGSTFNTLKNGSSTVPRNFDPVRRGVFHYAVFSHGLQLGGGVTPTTIGLAEFSRPNDDLTVALAPQVTTLGALAFQTVDRDRDGVPDLGGANLTGPRGLPVHGTVAHHARVFIHEIGHNFGLHHGAFTINGNPNYLSSMNTAYFAGITYDNIGNDNVADTTGMDYDGDGITDVRRFHFAHKLLPTLTESALDENVAIDPKPTPALARFTCGVPPGAQVTRADRPVDWDCDGITGETGANVGNNNINDFFGSGAPNEILLGYADYARLQNGGLELLPERTSVSLDDLHKMDSRTQRIREPQGREWFQQRCERPQRITFEEFPEQTAVDDEYAPLVRFLSDQARSPVIVGPSGRNGVPTPSQDRSLLNRTRSGPASLVMTFDQPQRVVRLQIGHGGFTQFPRERVRAVLRAFDQRGLPMGILMHDLIQTVTGVRDQMTAVAVFPDELILRVELTFEAVPARLDLTYKPQLIDEPVLIDNLEICGRLDETGLKPYLPPTPKFGDLRVALTIESEAAHETGVSPGGNPIIVHQPFTGLPVKVNGATSNTQSSVTRPEGTTLTLSAPLTHSGWQFLYWRHSSGVSFGNGLNVIPLTLLKDGTITAVYRGRRASPDPGDAGGSGGGRPDGGSKDCDCCCKCCEREERKSNEPR